MVQRINVHHCAKFFWQWVKPLNRYGDFSICQNGGRPPSWICYEHVSTTHEEYVVVFITVQAFVGIDAVVSIIYKCWYLTTLALKCLSTPPNSRFLWIIPVNGENPYRDPQWAPPCVRAGNGSLRVTHDPSDPLSSWPMTHVTHDPWVTEAVTPY